MKKLLLASLLLLSIAPAVKADDAPYEDMMTEKQQEYMRFNGVSVAIIRVNDRLISRRASADYEASLTNPYNRAIRCNIVLISSRGVNERYEVIDQKSHLGVYVPAKGITKMCGHIEIKHGRGDDGLQWVESKGNLVKAENCMFL
ncbi:MAG: hypothetical protein H7336_06955 [Bacteriovorax sp.]|nr:hypothetical protein [Bacteriovorax sp.]